LSSRLVCIDRIYEGKGPSILLAAAKQLASEGLQFEVVFAGDGDIRPDIEAHARKIGLSDRISITGWLSAQQVNEHIRAARCLVHPSFA
jgi:colanic acid/amylovoran biosynthesis glycosyltransferase